MCHLGDALVPTMGHADTVTGAVDAVFYHLTERKEKVGSRLEGLRRQEMPPSRSYCRQDTGYADGQVRR